MVMTQTGESAAETGASGAGGHGGTSAVVHVLFFAGKDAKALVEYANAHG